LAGRTSKARKGTSLDRVLGLFLDIDKPWLTTRNIGGLSTGEGLIHAVRDAVLNKKGEEADAGEPDKRLFVEPEFARVLKVGERETATLPSVLRAAWDGNKPLQTLIKSNPDRATAAYISIIGHITEAELRHTLSLNNRLNGFANRILWICVQRSKQLSRGGRALDPALERDLVARLRSAVEKAGRARKMGMSTRAWELWDEVYPELSEGVHGMLGAVTDRAEAQVRRLACIYAVLDGESFVKRAHLEAALEVWRYAFDSARFLFGQTAGDAKTEKIRKRLREAGKKGMSRTAIRGEIFNQNVSSEEIGTRLALLLELGEVRCKMIDNPAGAGRPIEQWYAVGYSED
jgi:hypothetical protein